MWGRVWGGHSPVQLESHTHSCARACAHTHIHTHTREHAHSRATPHAGACVRRAASSALWCAPYPLPLSNLGGGTKGNVGGPVRCLGWARLGRAPRSVPRRSLARPRGPWIKTIRTEQSGLDATFSAPTPRLKECGGAARGRRLLPWPPTVGRCERVETGGIEGE